jgi:MFS family permease
MTGNINISSKKFMAILFLYLSTFSWFFFFYGNYQFSSAVDVGYQVLGFRDTLFVLSEAVFLFCIVIFALIGSHIGEKYDRRKLLIAYTTFGVFSTALAWVFQGTIASLFSIGLVGTSFGLSFPVVMAYMKDCTVVDERARISGIVVFLSFVVAMLSTAIASSTSVVGIILLSIILRSLGFFALILDPCSRIGGRKHAWRKILTYKQFDFYILPFLMFTILSGLLYLIDIPKTAAFNSASSIGNIFHLAGTGVFAVIGGFVADRIGRRKPIMVGLVMLGISTAILGYELSPLTWIIYLAISGFAWGIVFVIYFAIPGDLAFRGSEERFYALGTIIPFIAYTSIQGPAQLIGLSLQANWIFPVLTIILFVSLIPLVYATETLPESKILEKQLEKHIKKVGELVEKSKNK